MTYALDAAFPLASFTWKEIEFSVSREEPATPFESPEQAIKVAHDPKAKTYKSARELFEDLDQE